jgi:hypothetical protein
LIPLRKSLKNGRGEVRELRGPETLVLEKLQMSNSYPETPGYCPDTPDHNVRIFRTLYRTFRINMDFHKKAIFSGRFDSHGFCRFF